MRRPASDHEGDADPSPGAHRAIRVLGTLEFRVGGTTAPVGAVGAQRLLALLALQDEAVARSAVARTLWPDVDEQHAASSLRSALSRMTAPVRAALVTTSSDLGLAADVDLDLRRARAIAHRLLDATQAVELEQDAVWLLSQEVLPDWYDDWAIVVGEEWRQLRLRALEALAGLFAGAGRYGEALGAALAAVRVDGLRESARIAVIRVHLAEGNRSEALRELARYRRLLAVELGLEPTDRLLGLFSGE